MRKSPSGWSPLFHFAVEGNATNAQMIYVDPRNRTARSATKRVDYRTKGWSRAVKLTIIAGIQGATESVLSQYFAQIRGVHIGCVALSGCLFFIRGSLHLLGHAIANHAILRVSSVLVDTVLLSAAVLLTLIVRQFPLTDDWLTMKLALLVVYIVLGSLALKRARRRSTRAIAFAAALLTYVAIIGVAVTHSPLGWWALLSHSS
jgi:uncharacterized membrane protein SirB2